MEEEDTKAVVSSVRDNIFVEQINILTEENEKLKKRIKRLKERNDLLEEKNLLYSAKLGRLKELEKNEERYKEQDKKYFALIEYLHKNFGPGR